MTRPARAGAAAVSLAVAVLAGCTATGPAASSSPTAEPAATPAATTPAASNPPMPVAAPPPPSTPIVGWPQPFTAAKLGVTAPIVGGCAVNPDGSIEPPPDIHAICVTGRADVDPAGAGVTTLTGHTTRDARTGALEQINQLAAGDTVAVGGRTWTVVGVTVVPADAPGLRSKLLETFDGPRRLVLGTCHLDDAVRAGAPYTKTDLAELAPA